MNLQEIQSTVRTLIAGIKDVRLKQGSSLNLVEGTSDDTALKLARIAEKRFVMIETKLREAEVTTSVLSLLPTLDEEAGSLYEEEDTPVALIPDYELVALEDMFATPEPYKPNETESELIRVTVVVHNEALAMIAQGRHQEAIEVCEKGLLKVQKDGPNIAYVERILNTLSLVYSSNKDYDYAIQALCYVLVFREQRLGDDSHAVALTLNNLTVLSEKQGNYKDGEQSCRRSLKIKEKVCGSESLLVGNQLYNMAALHQNQKQYGDAEKYYQRALKVYEDQVGLTDSITMRTRDNLAVCNRKRKKIAHAAAFYSQIFDNEYVAEFKRLLDESLKSYCEQDPLHEEADPFYGETDKLDEEADSLDEEADQFSGETDKLDEEADSLDEEADSLDEETDQFSGEIDPLQEESAVRHEEADPHHEEACSLCEEEDTPVDLIPDDEHEELKDMFGIPELYNPNVAAAKFICWPVVVHDLALAMIAKGRQQEAIEICKRNLVKIREAGPNIAYEERILNTLSLAYSSNKEYYSAIQALCNVLASREKRLGYYHHTVAVTLNNLAVLYAKQGNYMDGKQSCQRSLKINRIHFGSESLAVAKQLYNMAALYQNQKKYGDAEEYYLRALKVYQDQLGLTDPNTMRTRDNLAACKHHQGKILEVIRL